MLQCHPGLRELCRAIHGVLAARCVAVVFCEQDLFLVTGLHYRFKAIWVTKRMSNHYRLRPHAQYALKIDVHVDVVLRQSDNHEDMNRVVIMDRRQSCRKPASNRDYLVVGFNLAITKLRCV